MTKYEYKWVPSGEPILNINSKDGWRFVAFDATVQSGTQWVLMERPIPDSDTAQAEAAPSEREKRLDDLIEEVISELHTLTYPAVPSAVFFTNWENRALDALGRYDGGIEEG